MCGSDGHPLPCAGTRQRLTRGPHMSARPRDRLLRRQVTVGPTLSLCRVPRDCAHGKEHAAVPTNAVWSLPCAAHGKDVAVCKAGFAVCTWHTAKSLSPVVLACMFSIRSALSAFICTSHGLSFPPRYVNLCKVSNTVITSLRCACLNKSTVRIVFVDSCNKKHENHCIVFKLHVHVCLYYMY